MEPLLQAISDLLDDHEGLITTIQGDLQRGLKNPDTGRKGLTARKILSSLVLMGFRNRTRAPRRRMLAIQRMTRKRWARSGRIPLWESRRSSAPVQ
ncbi:MAG TPA: hypothetical protein VIH98_09065, partial [Xanthobacteraceae bacterium]